MTEVHRCPTAYALGSKTQQGTPVSAADREALQAYHKPKKRVITPAMQAHYARLHEYSLRTRPRAR